MKKELGFFGKKGSGTLDWDNLIMIILTLMFFMVAMTFVYRQGNAAFRLEQSYAKNIALLIDAGQPIMELRLDMEDAMAVAEKNGMERENIVSVRDNVITVQLTPKGGYEYSFFNNFDVTLYPDAFPGTEYIIKINGYNNDENNNR